jgi:hypothetical protein
MKLCQFQAVGGGRRVGVLDGDAVIDITAPRAGAGSVLELLLTGKTAAGIERLARQLSRTPRRQGDRHLHERSRDRLGEGCG